jgi:hypothetical protein
MTSVLALISVRLVALIGDDTLYGCARVYRAFHSHATSALQIEEALYNVGCLRWWRSAAAGRTLHCLSYNIRRFDTGTAAADRVEQCICVRVHALFTLAAYWPIAH